MPLYFKKGGWVGVGRMLATPLLYDLALVTSLFFRMTAFVCVTFKNKKRLKLDNLLFACFKDCVQILHQHKKKKR